MANVTINLGQLFAAAPNYALIYFLRLKFHFFKKHAKFCLRVWPISRLEFLVFRENSDGGMFFLIENSRILIETFH